MSEKRPKTAAVIGAGPAGLSAAEVLAQAGLKTTIYERMASPARKFLLAGRGGLNLTHSEDFTRFLARYGAAAERLKPFLETFGPQEIRDWCAGLGEETFVGTSGRVFPKNFKATPLLRAWLRRLNALGVELRLRANFRGFEGRAAVFETPQGAQKIEADVYVLALGGASWPRLGADGSWVAPLAEAGLPSSPLRPANCGLLIDWSENFLKKFEGRPLKNVRLHFGDFSARGECVVTKGGLEGGPVYALSGAIRDAVEALEVTQGRHCEEPQATKQSTKPPDGGAVAGMDCFAPLAMTEESDRIPRLLIDLRADVAAEKLAEKLGRRRGKDSLANFLRKSAGLNPLAVALLREGGPLPQAPQDLAARIKSAPLKIRGVAGLERAISTAGGVRFDALDENLMAKNFPGLFVAGEMLDWEAPTGGYLLTACFAMGRAAGAAAAAYSAQNVA